MEKIKKMIKERKILLIKLLRQDKNINLYNYSKVKKFFDQIIRQLRIKFKNLNDD